MENQTFKRELQELATENFRLYPENYPVKNGLATCEASENVSDLARHYWEHRTDEEIERDKNLQVSLIDYVEILQEAFSEFIE